MARLPIPGGDSGTWGDVLNEYLSQSHKADGTIKDNAVTSSSLAPNSVTSAAIATNAVGAASIADGSITETLLDSAVQAKLNQVGPTWSSLSGKPTVIAAGVDVESARAAIGAEIAGASKTMDDITDATAIGKALVRATNAADVRAVTGDCLGPRWVFDGDSITLGSIGSDSLSQDRARSWVAEMAGRSLGRINVVRVAAVSGHRSDQRLAAFATDVVPYTPDVVMLTIGTNDIGQSVAMSTWLDNLDDYLVACRGIGATLVIGEVWPTKQSSGRRDTVNAWNTALHEWASDNNILVVPWTRLSDPATGGWLSGWSSDDIHPTLQDAASQIGQFGFHAVESNLGPPVAVRRAVGNFDSALSNGFAVTLNSVLGVPGSRSATASTSSGTLPAGTYSYKVTGRNYWGEGLPSAEFTATLSGDGHIDVAATTPSGARGVNIYRKGAGDSDWMFVHYTANGTSPWTDDGSATLGAAISGIDTSAAPTGLVHGTSNLRSIDGPWLLTESGVRGNIMRLRRNDTPAADNDYFWVNVSPGQVVDFSCLVRAATDGEPTVALRWKSGAGNTGSDVGALYIWRQRVIADTWRLVHLQATVPSGVASVRTGFELDSSLSWLDIAEVRLAVS